jgi:hypothetical protein
MDEHCLFRCMESWQVQFSDRWEGWLGIGQRGRIGKQKVWPDAQMNGD